MLGQRRRRWPNVEHTLDQWVIFADACYLFCKKNDIYIKPLPLPIVCFN